MLKTLLLQNSILVRFVYRTCNFNFFLAPEGFCSPTPPSETPSLGISTPIGVPTPTPVMRLETPLRLDAPLISLATPSPTVTPSHNQSSFSRTFSVTRWLRVQMSGSEWQNLFSPISKAVEKIPGVETCAWQYCPAESSTFTFAF